MKIIGILMVILIMFLGSCKPTPEESEYIKKVQKAKRDQHISNMIEGMEIQASLRDASLHPKEITLGMTKEQATDLLGYPNDNNRSVGSWGVHEQWVYEAQGVYLYFENGILTSYQD